MTARIVAETMLRYVEDQLDAKAVHYQFTLAQDVEVLLEHSSADMDELETRLDTTTPLNIGSVSKLITAVTILKMADQGDSTSRIRSSIT